MSNKPIDIAAHGLAPCKCRSAKVGDVFGRLTVLAFGKKARRCVHAVCRCECGNVTSPLVSNLRAGKATSCGCYRQEFQRQPHPWGFQVTHGMSRNPVHKVWRGMMDRCHNSRSRVFKDYGGRGISVAPEWHDFDTFYRDMSPTYERGLTIERNDNNAGYSASNCRWAPMSEQVLNKRSTKWHAHNGMLKTYAQWARYGGVNKTTVARRIQKGRPPI